MQTTPEGRHLRIGGLIFPNMDQCDFTGPFEALSRIPNSTFYTLWKDKGIVRDMQGMQLVPDTSFEEAPHSMCYLFREGMARKKPRPTRRFSLLFVSKPSVPCRSTRYVPGILSAAPLACCMVEGRRLTGQQWMCCRFMALLLAMIASSSTVIT